MDNMDFMDKMDSMDGMHFMDNILTQTTTGLFKRTTLFLLSLTSVLPAADLSIDNKGNLSFSEHRIADVNSKYVFWGENWKWANAASKFDGNQITGHVQNLGLHFAAEIERVETGAAITYIVQADRTIPNVIGGGFEFNIMRGEGATLLSDGSGWEWQGHTVRFDPPMERLYFERGNNKKIRAMWKSQGIEKGETQFRMLITLPDGSKVVEARENEVESKWLRGALLPTMVPVDLSYLNHKPAGSRGFVRVVGDQLEFEDGTPARFWGTNIAAYAIASAEPDIDRHAKRLAQLGHNLVRIHHHDSTRWVQKTVIAQGGDNSRQLDPAMMDRLDYWIAALKREGIYVWLDLHVGRQFREGDQVAGFQELKGQEAKGFSYYNKDVQELMEEFTENYLTHKNRYTGLAYREDPAVMGILITNENDLTFHFGNALLPDKNVPFHSELQRQDVARFAKKWNLSAGKSRRTWEPGESKLYLNDAEHRFNERMLTQLEALQIDLPIATTNSWGNPHLFSLPALTDGSIIDAHSYGKEENLSHDPQKSANLITSIAISRVAGMPLSITEWNVPYPTIDRYTAPLYMAAMAAFQEWSAPMLYNYSQRGLGVQKNVGTWSTFVDPAITGLLPAAAIAYREGHVAPSDTRYHLKVTPEQLYFQNWNRDTTVALRTLAEQHGVEVGMPKTAELPWLAERKAADGVVVIEDPAENFLEGATESVISETGELVRNWVKGIHTIDTPSTQAVSGWIGGETLHLGDTHFQIRTPSATVAITALDQLPIRQSGKLLISAIGQAKAPGNKLPFLSELVEGVIQIRTDRELAARTAPGNGERSREVAIDTEGQWTEVQLSSDLTTHWLLLEATDAVRSEEKDHAPSLPTAPPSPIAEHTQG